MKKNFFLTLMLAVLCTATSWAQFAPKSGTKYALKEVKSGLYLDIQTGVYDGNKEFSNCLSLSTDPCVIYFAAGTTDNTKWTMKNVNGTYAMQGTKHWIANIGTTQYEWSIAEPEPGVFTIARADGKYIGVDSPANGACLYCDRGTGLEFALVEYTDLSKMYYTLKSPNPSETTYFSLESSGDTEASFRTAPTKFYVVPSADIYFFQNKDNSAQHIGCTASGQNDWRVSIDFAWWKILDDADNDGFVQIKRSAEEKYLGNDTFYESGKGIYSNVGSGCFGWLFEGTYENYPTVGTINNSKYHFTSDYITYAGACNKIRFTLTESGAFFQNGKNRMSLDEFAIYDADGKKIELTVANVTGNNNKTYEGLFDGVNGKCGGTATWNDGTEDDWFEILLPVGVDLGGAFKFSFVTENTQMNAKKFTINTSYEKPADYTVVINAPQGETVTVTYDGEAIKAGDKVTSVGFDKSLVDSAEIAILIILSIIACHTK